MFKELDALKQSAGPFDPKSKLFKAGKRSWKEMEEAAIAASRKLNTADPFAGMARPIIPPGKPKGSNPIYGKNNMFRSILFKLGILYLLMDTFIRRPFHLENLLSVTKGEGILRPALEAGFHSAGCKGHDAIVISPYFWLLVLYFAIFVIVAVSLMLYDSSIIRIRAREREKS